MYEQIDDTTTTTSRKRYYTGGAIVTVVLLVILILSLLYILLPRNRCKLLIEEPYLGELLAEEKNFASAYNTALANMIGYLRFPKRGYLPLVLSEFEVAGGTATLASECATLTWNYEIRDAESNSTQIYLNKLELLVPTEEVIVANQTDSRHTCSLNHRHYNFTPTQMFSCKFKITGKCIVENDDEKSVAEIVLASLELELLGDPRTIREKEFSVKRAANNSCRIFRA